MGLGSAPVVAFVPATDLARSRAFYEGGLGLPVRELTSFALVLGGDGATIRVTLVPVLEARPFTVLGWEVTDIAADVADLAGRGVEFVRYDGMGQDEHGIWTAPDGAKVAWFCDPDGNVLSLTQHP
jgi:catechol 2,3-dioxygenase-like lactoylglutathione lyase family enzyme